MSEESDSLRTSPSVASLSENELPLPPPEPPGYVCSLTEDLVTKAREELQEKPEWRLRDVQALRDMVRKEYPYLSTSLDDAFLLRFLRARKFDYDRALQLLVNYHGCRRNWPEVFSNLRPSALKDVLNSGFLTVLPHTDPRGCHVLCIRPGTGGTCDPSGAGLFFTLLSLKVPPLIVLVKVLFWFGFGFLKTIQAGLRLNMQPWMILDS